MFDHCEDMSSRMHRTLLPEEKKPERDSCALFLAYTSFDARYRINPRNDASVHPTKKTFYMPVSVYALAQPEPGLVKGTLLVS